MAGECKRDRLEQSDMIMILFNLAYIPDVVAKEIDFTVEQWSVKFLENMKKFKEDWEQKNDRPWSYQTNEIEQEYKEFINSKKASDDLLQKDIAEEKVQVALEKFMKDSFTSKKSDTPKQE